MPPTFISRYNLTTDDLRSASLVLQLGEGAAERINSAEAVQFIVKAEDWAEGQVEEFIAVPLRPVRALGQSRADFIAALANNALTTRNFPPEFIQSILYKAVSLLLSSEFSQTSPNQSDSVKWAEDAANNFVLAYRDRLTVRVGGGRKRHPNPHMPPTIAPRQPPPQQFR